MLGWSKERLTIQQRAVRQCCAGQVNVLQTRLRSCRKNLIIRVERGARVRIAECWYAACMATNVACVENRTAQERQLRQFDSVTASTSEPRAAQSI
jgi:hypothetical protein